MKAKQHDIVRDILERELVAVHGWGVPENIEDEDIGPQEYLEAIEAAITRLQLAKEQDDEDKDNRPACDEGRPGCIMEHAELKGKSAHSRRAQAQQRNRGKVSKMEYTCEICGARLVEDDTTGRIYCEENADHTPIREDSR